MALANLALGWLALPCMLLAALLLFCGARGLSPAGLVAALGERTWGRFEPAQRSALRLRQVDQELRQLARRIPSGFAAKGQPLPRYLLLNASSQDTEQFVNALSCSWERSEAARCEAKATPSLGSAGFRWWRNQDAMILEPCSSYLQGVAAPSELRGCLRKILRHQRQHSFDAVLLLISAQDLRPAFEQTLSERGQRLREAVQLWQQTSGDAPPLQLIIDEVDRVEGFDAFAQCLREDERNRNWGSYIEPPTPAQSWALQGQKALGRLHAALHQRCQQAMLLEGEPLESGAIYRFTQRIQEMQAPLESFLHALFPSSQGPYALRHLFLSGHHAGGCNFAAKILHEGQLRDSLAVRSERRAREKKERLGRIGLALGIACGLMVWTLPYLSARENRGLQAELRSLTLAARVEGTPQERQALLESSARLHRKLDRLGGAPGLRYGLGMNQSPTLVDPARALFVGLMNQGPLAPLFSQSAQRMEDLLRQDGSLDAAQLEELRAVLLPYVLLTQSEQSPSASEISNYAAELRASILPRLRDDGSSKMRIEAEGIAQQYLQAIADVPSLRQPGQGARTLAARHRLLDEATLRTRVRHLVQKLRDKGPAIDPRSVAPDSKASAALAPVPFGYTREGYNSFAKKSLHELANTLQRESWLHPDPQSAQGWAILLRKIYLEEYQAHWQKFVDGITFPFAGAAPALPLEHDRRSLSFQQAYQSLANTLQHNTQWSIAAPEGGPKAATPMALHFLPLIRFAQADKPDLQSYLELLRVLDREGAALEQSEVSRLSAQAMALAARQPDPWKAWFARRLGAAFDQEAKARIRHEQQIGQASWCTLVQSMKRDLFQHYPFAAQASKESRLESLSQLLHPSQGLLWKRVDAQLATWVTRRGSRFVANPSAKVKLHPRLLAFLNAAWRLSQSLFTGPASDLQLELKIEARPQSQVHRTRFEWGHQRYIYSNGPERAQRIRWPADSKRPVALFEARHSQGSVHRYFQGPWALFHLLESGSPRRESKGSYFSLRWKSKVHPGAIVSMRLRPLGQKGAWAKAKSGSLLKVFRNPALTHPPGRLFLQSPSCPNPSSHSI